MKKTLTTLALTGFLLAPLANADTIQISFSYNDPNPVSGVATLTATDLGGGQFLATAGTLTLSGGNGLQTGTYSLIPGGPAVFGIPGFSVDDLVFPGSDPILDVYGLAGFQYANTYLNIWGNSPGNYSLYTGGDNNYSYNGPITFTAQVPDGGTTLGLLGVALVGLGWARRKLA